MSLTRIFVLVLFLSISSVAQSRLISIDYGRIKGPRDRFPQLVVGAGRAVEGLRADWQRDLALVHRECGFEYVRFHGLLQDELGVYAEDRNGKPVYNFQYLDAVYDAIINAGMHPFVEFGFMPQKLASGDKTIFWWKGNITPPRDHAKWEALVSALVEHWTTRYGRDEVRRWYFEVWNEPNLKDLFWSGDQSDYFKLYDVTVRAVKSVSPEFRVGGPATAGRAWIGDMIAHAAQASVPLDFITTHDYGVRDVRAQIKKSVMPDLPLHYTEWSTSYSPLSYWTFTDIFEESGPVPSPFHGGFGLINFQGLRKPSFYAYEFLHRLSKGLHKNSCVRSSLS